MAVFTLRPMTPADKPAVLGIASRTWEGSDYLPFVFDDWIADTDGEFVAALLEGRVVGCGKLSFLTPYDAWLEGLRKDPEVTQGGLAELVNRYYLRRLAGRPGLRLGPVLHVGLQHTLDRGERAPGVPQAAHVHGEGLDGESGRAGSHRLPAGRQGRRGARPRRSTPVRGSELVA